VGNARPYEQDLFEAGLSQRVTGRFFIDLGAYRHTGRNAFENAEIANTRLFVPTNFTKARARGLELADLAQ